MNEQINIRLIRTSWTNIDLFICYIRPIRSANRWLIRSIRNRVLFDSFDSLDLIHPIRSIRSIRTIRSASFRDSPIVT